MTASKVWLRRSCLLADHQSATSDKKGLLTYKPETWRNLERVSFDLNIQDAGLAFRDNVFVDIPVEDGATAAVRRLR